MIFQKQICSLRAEKCKQIYVHVFIDFFTFTDQKQKTKTQKFH